MLHLYLIISIWRIKNIAYTSVGGGDCNPLNYEDAKTVFYQPLNVKDKKLYSRIGNKGLTSEGIKYQECFVIAIPDNAPETKLEDCYSLEDCKKRCSDNNTRLSKKEERKLIEFFDKYPDSIIKFKLYRRWMK